VILIGIGLTAVSQNQKMITDYQLKQIRLLENQAKTDSIKVIELLMAIDTLQTVCDLKGIRLQNCDSIQMLQSETINLQKKLIETNEIKLSLSKVENKGLKKTIRNRTLLFIGSAILNTFLIIKIL
jgi:hypothetical protein